MLPGFIWLSYLSNESEVKGDGSVGKGLAAEPNILNAAPQLSHTGLHRAAGVCSPSADGTETDRSLELTGWPSQCKVGRTK